MTLDQRLSELDGYAVRWRDSERRATAEGRPADADLAAGWARMVEREAAKLRLREAQEGVRVTG